MFSEFLSPEPNPIGSINDIFEVSLIQIRNVFYVNRYMRYILERREPAMNLENRTA